MKLISRRKFLQTGAVLVTVPYIIPSRVLGADAPSNKINIGFIGTGSHGLSWNLKRYLELNDAKVLVVCDVDDNHLRNAKAMVDKQYMNTDCAVTKDFRKVIGRKDIDAVMISTPDHWHTLISLMVLREGKDVQCEKPTLTINEGKILIDAVRKNKRVFQTSTEDRSIPVYHRMAELVRNGRIGKLQRIEVVLPKLPDRPGDPTPQPVPPELDYEMWLGPAPKRPFNKNRFHLTWRWYWDYAGGLMTDWGVHLIDYILYGMGKTVPISVMAIGGKYAFPDDAMETPDTMTAVYDFKDFTMIWEHTIGIGLGNWKRPHGMSYIGENGTLVLDRNGWEVVPEKQRIEALPVQKNVGVGLDLHVKNFLDCLKNNTPQKLNASINIGRDVALVAQMGNIAFRTGEKVNWDDTKQSFQTRTANTLIVPVYHNGWTLPKY